MTIDVSNDLVSYRTIILSLVSYAQHPKLDTLIEKLTPQVHTSQLFLIKMEIKRLAKPCTRILDYRLWFDDCEPVQYQNICHYLDEISKSLFLEHLKNNNGQFTVFLYHEISQQAKSRHLAQEKKKRVVERSNSPSLTDTVKTISLVNKNRYQAPPLNCHSKCKIFSYDPLSMSRKGKEEIGLSGTIVDLNMLTCILKSAAIDGIAQSQEIFIWFYDHNSQLNIKEDIVLAFTIEDYKKSLTNDKVHYRLKLKQKNNSKMINALSDLLKAQFELRREQYNQKILPLFDSVYAKSHQQYVINSTCDIPMLCSKEQNAWYPASAIKTPSNNSLWEFISPVAQQSIVGGIFTNAELEFNFSQRPCFEAYAYLLRFDHAEQQEFAIVWQDQLQHDPSALAFIQQHLNQCDYRYIKLSIKPVNALEDAYVPSALPNHVNSAMAILNRPLTKTVASALSKTQAIAILSDVTEINDVLALPEAMAVKKVTVSKKTKIPLQFCLPKHSQKSDMEVVEVANNDLRSEDRFEYEISAKITRYGNTPCSIQAVSKNISAKGLSISLDKPYNFKPGAELRLSFAMPYRGELISINNQKYQIIGGNNDKVIRLTISGLEKQHVASQAIKEFIYQNMDQLTPCGLDKNQTYGLSQAVQNVYANNHFSIPFFIRQNKQKWFINTLALNETSNIPTLQADRGLVKQAIANVVSDDKFQEHCLAVINKVNTENRSAIFYLIVLPRENKETQQVIHSIGDLQKIRQSGRLTELMDKLMAYGEPTILRIQITKPSRIHNKTFKEELNYLEQLSPIDMEDVLEDINGVAGVGEITDHSQHVLENINRWLYEEERILLSEVG